MCGDVCNHSAYGTETDNTQSFSEKLASREFALSLLYRFCDILSKSGCPIDTAHDITGSKQQRGYGKLLYSVCIRSGGIENDDSLLRAFLDRNIINSGSRACDRLKLRFEFRIVKRCRTHHYRAGIGNILADIIFRGIKFINADRGNFIHKLYIVHFINSVLRITAAQIHKSRKSCLSF